MLCQKKVPFAFLELNVHRKTLYFPFAGLSDHGGSELDMGQSEDQVG